MSSPLHAIEEILAECGVQISKQKETPITAEKTHVQKMALEKRILLQQSIVDILIEATPNTFSHMDEYTSTMDTLHRFIIACGASGSSAIASEVLSALLVPFLRPSSSSSSTTSHNPQIVLDLLASFFEAGAFVSLIGSPPLQHLSISSSETTNLSSVSTTSPSSSLPLPTTQLGEASFNSTILQQVVSIPDRVATWCHYQQQHQHSLTAATTTTSSSSSIIISIPTILTTETFFTRIQMDLYSLIIQHAQGIYEAYAKFPASSFSPSSSSASITTTTTSTLASPSAASSQLRTSQEEEEEEEEEEVDSLFASLTTTTTMQSHHTNARSRTSSEMTAWVSRLHATIQRLVKRGYLLQFLFDWSQCVYSAVGMGGCLLLSQSEEQQAKRVGRKEEDNTANTISTPTATTIDSSPSDTLNRPEYPTADKELQRAKCYQLVHEVTVLDALSLSLSPDDDTKKKTTTNLVLLSTCRSILSTSCGIAADFISCTPEAGRLVHPVRVEAAFASKALGVLKLLTGSPTSSNNNTTTNMLRKVFQDILYTIPLSGIEARLVLCFLCHPLFKPATVVDMYEPSEITKIKMSTPPKASLIHTHGCISSFPPLSRTTTTTTSSSSSSSSSLKSDILRDFTQQTHFDILRLVKHWSSPKFLFTTDGLVQESVTRILHQVLLLIPAIAFQPTYDLVALLMQGIQERMDSNNDSIHTQGRCIAEVMSQRLTPDTPLKFHDDDSNSGTGGSEKEEGSSSRSSSNTSSTGTSESGTIFSADLSIRDLLESLRKMRENPPKHVPNTTLEHASSTTTTITTNNSNMTEKIPTAASTTTTTLQQRHGKKETPVLTTARAKFAALAPTYIAQAYTRVMCYMKDENDGGGSGGDTSGGGGGALPVPAGAALDEDSKLMSTPEGSAAVFSTLGRLIRKAAESTTYTAAGGQAQSLEYAIPLLRVLLSIGNRYADPHFPPWRFHALVSIVVCVGPLATDYLYSRYTALPMEVSEGTRIEILDILVFASKELSGASVVLEGGSGGEDVEEKEKEGNIIIVPLPPWEEATWTGLVDVDDYGDGEDGSSTNELKEKKGQKLKQQQQQQQSNEPHRTPTPSINLFGPLAYEFFFLPLLRAITATTTTSAGQSTGSTATTTAPAGSPSSIDSDVAAMISQYNPAVAAFGIVSDSSTSSSMLTSSGKSLLLSQALRALAVFLELSSFHRDSSSQTKESTITTTSTTQQLSMIRSLFPLAWVVRTREDDTAVRFASLSAIAAVIGAIHKYESSVLLTPSVLQGLGTVAVMANGTTTSTAPGAAGQGGKDTDVGVVHISTTPNNNYSNNNNVNPLSDMLSVGTKLSQQDVLTRLAVQTLGVATATTTLSSSEAKKLQQATTPFIVSRSSSNSNSNGNNGGETTLSLSSSSSSSSSSSHSDIPTIYDDLVQLVAWLNTVADSDPDPACRQMAGVMLRNAILRELLLGPQQ